MAQRERVVLAEALDMADLEALLLHRRDDGADLVQLAVREDVPVDEASSDRAANWRGRPAAG